MNRRRTRYKFLAQHDKHAGLATRIDVIAYSLDGAIGRLERAGYYNIERVKAAARLRPRGGGFTFDQAAIKAAQEFLGLKWPVKIRTHSRVGNTLGNYRLRDAGRGPLHDIMVKDYLTPEQAGQTLWHELAHAMQAEREAAARPGVAPTVAWSTCAARGRGIGYSRKPIEVEAREHEALNADHPLTR